MSKVRLERMQEMESVIQVRHPKLYGHLKRRVWPILSFDNYYELLRLLLEVLEGRKV